MRILYKTQINLIKTKIEVQSNNIIIFVFEFQWLHVYLTCTISRLQHLHSYVATLLGLDRRVLFTLQAYTNVMCSIPNSRRHANQNMSCHGHGMEYGSNIQVSE